MSVPSGDRPLLRIAARLLVVGVWTALPGLGILLVAPSVGPVGTSPAGVASVALGGLAALRRGALAVVALGGALAMVGGLAFLVLLR